MRLTRDRFWTKVERGESCWNWIGNRSQSGRGYGQISIGDSLKAAHRVSWEMHYGPIPKGQYVLHSCDNKACVRPEHLFLGTAATNTVDAVRKQRIKSLKLNADAVEEIRRLRMVGVVSSKIAARFGIHEAHARKVAGRKAWIHVS